MVLTTRCEGHKPRFLQPEAAILGLQAARQMDREGQWWLFAATVMPDHVRLVVRGRGQSTAKLMHLFKGRAAHQINLRMAGSGRFWQPGYQDSVIEGQDMLMKQIRDCLENPVRAGLVGHWRQYPHSWSRWSLL